jgi:hypothetical protein
MSRIAIKPHRRRGRKPASSAAAAPALGTPGTGGNGIMIKGYDPVITGEKCVTTLFHTPHRRLIRSTEDQAACRCNLSARKIRSLPALL